MFYPATVSQKFDRRLNGSLIYTEDDVWWNLGIAGLVEQCNQQCDSPKYEQPVRISVREMYWPNDEKSGGDPTARLDVSVMDKDIAEWKPKGKTLEDRLESCLKFDSDTCETIEFPRKMFAAFIHSAVESKTGLSMQMLRSKKGAGVAFNAHGAQDKARACLVDAWLYDRVCRMVHWAKKTFPIDMVARLSQPTIALNAWVASSKPANANMRLNNHFIQGATVPPEGRTTLAALLQPGNPFAGNIVPRLSDKQDGDRKTVKYGRTLERMCTVVG